MTNTVSIKKRVILTVSSVCIVSVALLGFIAYRNQMHQLREGLQDLAKNESQLFQSILVADAEGLARAHTGLDRLDSLLRPFAAGNRDELLSVAQPIFKEIKQSNNITHMYFIAPDGKVLLRVHKPEQSGDSLKRTTFKTALSTGTTSSGLEMGANFFSLRCVRPVSYQGMSIGYMEVAEEIDHVFKQMKGITGNDVSLLLTDEFLGSQKTDLKSEKVGNFSILYPTSKETTLQLAAKLLPEMRAALHEPKVSIVSLRGGKYVVGIAPVQDAAGTTVGVLFSQKEVSSLFSTMWKGVASNIVILFVIVASALALLYFSLRSSLALFDTLRRHIVRVTTTWDLNQRLHVETHDEIGQLADDFNTMTEKLSVMVTQVNRSSIALGEVSSDIIQVSGKVMSAAEQQVSSVNNASSAMTQINASIKGVTQGVESLSQSAHESSSSILEMAASIDEVALSAAALSQSVEEVSSAIGQMTAAIKEVGANAGNLMEAASANASSILEMDSSIKGVEKNALSAASISEAVRKDAEVGREAVEATILGMARIRDASHITSDSVQTLSRRAGDIGAILSVINEVAGRTNLLALNAAIIAAQAGEHGKGFAVVAGEIKELADRTSRSTGEISQVIKGVHDDTERAVAAIGEAEKIIVEGESLSRKSGEALEKIVSGVQMATVQVNSIARSTTEQAKGSRMISAAMEQVSGMVSQIARSTRELGGGSEMIMTAVERMKTATEQVKNSTREQSSVGNLIAGSTENITEMIRKIKHACDEQSRGSDQIVPAVENIKLTTDSNLEAVRVLNETVSRLKAQIDVLQSEIGRLHATEVPNVSV